jgi:anti-sigma B factor antagonist
MTKQEKFTVNKKKYDEIEFMFLEGFLDAHTAPILETAIQESLGSGKYKIIMNFENLDYISSAGLGVFMSFIEEIRNNSGDIKMCGMNEKVFSVFDLLGFPMLFDIDNNEQELIKKFELTEEI